MTIESGDSCPECGDEVKVIFTREGDQGANFSSRMFICDQCMIILQIEKWRKKKDTK